MFPHIFDAILSHADAPTLAAIGATSSAVRAYLEPAAAALETVHDPGGRCPAHRLFPKATKAVQRQILTRALVEGHGAPLPISELDNVVVVLELRGLEGLKDDGAQRWTRFAPPDLRGKRLTVRLPPFWWTFAGRVHEQALQTYLCYLSRADSITVVGFGCCAAHTATARTTLRRAVACSRAGNDNLYVGGVARKFVFGGFQCPGDLVTFVLENEYVGKIGKAEFARENWRC
jgi:hypothetical protein